MLNDPAFELGLGAASLSSTSNRVSERVEFLWPIAEQFALSAMGAAHNETLNIARPELISVDARRHEGTIGSSIQWKPLEPVTLQGSARLDIQATQSTNQDASATYPMGRLGGALELLDGWLLLSNWGYYARAPTLGELYGTSAFVVGNPSLMAEKGFNRDIGTRYATRGNRATIAVESYAFRQDINKLVSWQRSSFGQIKPYNVGQAQLQGLETSLGLELISAIHVESGVTLLDPRDDTPGRSLKNNIIPFRSRLVADGSLDIHTSDVPRTLGLARASIALRASHRSSRYQDAAGLIIIPHSTTFDLSLNIMFARIPLSLRASIYNLFDQPTFDMVGYPLPPRTLMLGAEFDWERRP